MSDRGGVMGAWLRGSGRIGIVVELAVVFGVPLGLLKLVTGFVGEQPMVRESLVAVAVLLMVVLLWLALRWRGEGARDLGMRWGRVGGRQVFGAGWRALVLGVAALVGFVGAGAVASALLPAAGAVEPGGFEGLKGNPWMLVAMLVTVWVTSSFAEEVIYRGYLIGRLARLAGGGKAGWAAGLVVGSVAFGLAHWDWGIVGVVQTGAMGFVLGAGFLWSGRNLWIAALAHGMLDTLLLVSLYFAP